MQTVTDISDEVNRTCARTEADIVIGRQCVLVVAGDAQTAGTGETNLSFAEESRLAVLG